MTLAEANELQDGMLVMMDYGCQYTFHEEPTRTVYGVVTSVYKCEVSITWEDDQHSVLSQSWQFINLVRADNT